MRAELEIERDGNLRAVSVDAGSLEQVTAGMMALPLELLSYGDPLPADSYVPTFEGEPRTLSMIRLAPADHSVPPAVMQRLSAAGLDVIYVPRGELGTMVDYLGDKMARRIADPAASDTTKAKLLYNHAVLIVDQAMTSERMGHNLDQGRNFVENLLQFLRTSPSAMQALASMLALDYTLYTHSVNTCLLTTSLMRFLGKDDRTATELGVGALYHDIGKSRLPRELLCKPGPLSSEEWRTMRQHPSRGAEILGRHPEFPKQALNMVAQHHENLDGTGYPHQLTAEQIGFEGRIMRIVDTYDAITSTRCYQDGVMAADGIRIMQMEMAGQVDRALFVRFIRFLGLISAGRRQVVNEAYAWTLD